MWGSCSPLWQDKMSTPSARNHSNLCVQDGRASPRDGPQRDCQSRYQDEEDVSLWQISHPRLRWRPCISSWTLHLNESITPWYPRCTGTAWGKPWEFSRCLGVFAGEQTHLFVLERIRWKFFYLAMSYSTVSFNPYVQVTKAMSDT